MQTNSLITGSYQGVLTCFLSNKWCTDHLSSKIQTCVDGAFPLAIPQAALNLSLYKTHNSEK